MLHSIDTEGRIVAVGGDIAGSVDYAAHIRAKLPVVMAFVVMVSRGVALGNGVVPQQAAAAVAVALKHPAAVAA